MEIQPSHHPEDREPDNIEHPELEGIDLTQATPRDRKSREVATEGLISAIQLAGNLTRQGARYVARDLAQRQREILTGQNEMLRNVIHQAVLEAYVITDEFPEWGARALSRELADRSDDPSSGALHHYATTGQIDKEAMTAELENIHDNATDKEIFTWALILDNYVRDQTEEPGGDTPEADSQ